MKNRKQFIAAVTTSVATLGATSSALALTGLLHSLLPALPDLPPFPPLLENAPGISLPDGAIPNFVLELPLPLPLQNIALPAPPLPRNPDKSTVRAFAAATGKCSRNFFARWRDTEFRTGIALAPAATEH